MSIKGIREAEGLEHARISAVQSAIGHILQASELDVAMAWNVLVNMLCGLSVEHEIDKDDVMNAVSTVYDMQALHMIELDKTKPN